MSWKFNRAALAAIASATLTTPAFAHHMMDGKTPTTFADGLLSGLAHPVIGPDHLGFLAAIGLAAAIVPGGLGLILAFVAASTAGVLAHVAAIDVPYAEALVAASVIAGGVLVAVGKQASAKVWLSLAVLAGLVHGYAFGESIVGADRAVLGSYLLGLAIVSTAVAIGVMQFTRAVLAPRADLDRNLRAAGVVVGSVGLFMLATGLAS